MQNDSVICFLVFVEWRSARMRNLKSKHIDLIIKAEIEAGDFLKTLDDPEKIPV